MTRPRAGPFDLDNTRIDRGRSIVVYAMLFCRDFRRRLSAIVTGDRVSRARRAGV